LKIVENIAKKVQVRSTTLECRMRHNP